MYASHAIAAAASHPVVVEAGLLHVVRNAVIAVVVIVFLIGGFLGFILGKAFGRRTR